MPYLEAITQALGFIVVLAPLTLVPILGISSLLEHPLTERTSDRLIRTAIGIGLVAALLVLGIMLFTDERHVEVPIGEWVMIPKPEGGHSYHFSVEFVFDRLSVPFVILSFILCGTIGAFAGRYLHREPGYNRFFVLYAFFVAGMVITSLAGTIETLFAGWELVGLSSALLVGFFQERPAPVRNALWVWGIYRMSDAALLIAAIVMHHMKGSGSFDQLCGEGTWPDERVLGAVSEQQALIVGSLLLFAAAGKSALVPFSGWLPRAMEGPTPSSAVFYGALSVHMGAFLLLRISPLLELSPVLCVVVMSLGLTTAAFASLASRVQTDIKSALSFASLTQVGIIVAEIGLAAFLEQHWILYVALVHLLGHACLRTLQFVRAPTLLQDYRGLENAIGGQLPRSLLPWDRLFPASVRAWLYRFALERGYLDAALNDYIATPFTRVFRWCDALERRWTDLLTGVQSRESDEATKTPERVDELI